jgi:F0F1-type ATP synthase epsilon subunit
MFKVKILDYKEVLYSGQATEVILSSEEGEIAIMDFHQPILSRLSKGIINIDRELLFKIKDGVSCFKKGELSAIVET